MSIDLLYALTTWIGSFCLTTALILTITRFFSPALERKRFMKAIGTWPHWIAFLCLVIFLGCWGYESRDTIMAKIFGTEVETPVETTETGDKEPELTDEELAAKEAREKVGKFPLYPKGWIVRKDATHFQIVHTPGEDDGYGEKPAFAIWASPMEDNEERTIITPDDEGNFEVTDGDHYYLIFIIDIVSGNESKARRYAAPSEWEPTFSPLVTPADEAEESTDPPTALGDPPSVPPADPPAAPPADDAAPDADAPAADGAAPIEPGFGDPFGGVHVTRAPLVLVA